MTDIPKIKIKTKDFTTISTTILNLQIVLKTLF